MKKKVKIIATTDMSLRNKGDRGIIDIAMGEDMPSIPQSFIEEYVKNDGKIDEVMIEYEEIHPSKFRRVGTIERIAATSLHLALFPKVKTDSNNEVIIHTEDKPIFTKDHMIAFGEYIRHKGKNILTSTEDLLDEYINHNYIKK